MRQLWLKFVRLITSRLIMGRVHNSEIKFQNLMIHGDSSIVNYVNEIPEKKIYDFHNLTRSSKNEVFFRDYTSSLIFYFANRNLVHSAIAFCGISNNVLVKSLFDLFPNSMAKNTVYLIDPFDQSRNDGSNKDPRRAMMGLEGKPNIEVIKEYIPHALRQIEQKLDFLHLDTVNPKAEIDSVRMFSSLINKGGLVLFDSFFTCSTAQDKKELTSALHEIGFRTHLLPTLQLLAIHEEIRND